jgi:hypothetical protein
VRCRIRTTQRRAINRSGDYTNMRRWRDNPPKQVPPAIAPNRKKTMTIDGIRAELEAIKANKPMGSDEPWRFADKLLRMFELQVCLAELLSNQNKRLQEFNK